MVAAAIETVLIVSTSACTPLTSRCSPSTTAPSTTATTGSSTSIVGTDVCSDPAWNADCCRTTAITPSTASRYGTGVVSSARAPSWVSRYIASLVSTATTPNNTPTATARNTARRQPMVRMAT